MATKPHDIPVTRRKILEFGLVFFVILAVIVPVYVGWKHAWEWQAWLWWPVGIGTALMGLCAATGMWMAPVYRAWMRLALLLGTVMTAVIVTLVFYLLITPIGLLRRALGSKSAYLKGFDRQAPTYWTAREEKADAAGMEKMY